MSSPPLTGLRNAFQGITIHQDLATYEVSEITPCLRVREAVEGSGSYPQIPRNSSGLTMEPPNRWQMRLDCNRPGIRDVVEEPCYP